MIKYFLIALILHSTWAKCQLASLVWHGDTLYCVNPSNGYQVQLNKDPVNWATGVLGKPTTLSGFGITDAPTTSTLSTIATSGSYNDLANKPILSTVATTGNYNDLINKPSISAQVNSDWNAISGVSQILNKPTLATVATTGSYNDLLNKPTNPTITLSGDISGSGTTAITTTIGAGKVTNTMLAGSIDLTTKVTGVLPFANGGLGASASTSATTGTMTVNMTSGLVTITPTGACTFNASGGILNQRVTFIITTSGVSSFIMTWGTNFRTTATLATGTVTAKKFCVSFMYDGSLWLETGRTASM